jgi:hypothetical protein
MNIQEIKSIFLKTTEALEQKRLKDVFDKVTFLLSNISNWQLNEKLSEWQDNYKMMLLYLSEGVNDPKQEKIYTDLLRSVYQLADQTTVEIKAQWFSSYHYELRRSSSRYFQETSEQIINSMND